MLIGLLIWAVNAAFSLVTLAVRPFVLLIGKKRILRWISAILNDPRVERGLVESGTAAGILQFRGLLAQMRMQQEGDIPAETTTGEAAEPEPPIHAAWPKELPPVPDFQLIQEVSLGMREAGADIEDWRFATFQAFQFSGASLMITEGCAAWARMAQKSGVPTELVRSSFTGAAILTAFQLGLIVGEYSYEQELTDSLRSENASC